MPITLTWILPAHNEDEILRESINRLRLEARHRRGSSIKFRALIIENGSSDSTWDVAQTLSKDRDLDFEILAFKTETTGLGEAYRLGITQGQLIDPSASHWLLASAADLPFGVSDLEKILEGLSRDPGPRVWVGSKLHPESAVKRDLLRSTLTRLFLVFRTITLNFKIRDTQGTFCLPASLASQALVHCRSTDFFFSTEFLFHCHQLGHKIEEIPVNLEPERRKSSVRPVRDAALLFFQTLGLALRARRTP